MPMKLLAEVADEQVFAVQFESTTDVQLDPVCRGPCEKRRPQES